MHDADNVIVLRGITTRQHPEGESIIRYAVRTTNLSATAENMTLESAAKGGRMKLVMQQKDGGGGLLDQLDTDQMLEQAARLQEGIQMGDVAYDDSGSTLTPINMSMADLQMLESRKFSVSDIARFFSVPRSLLMDDSNSNYKTNEQATLDFLSHTLQPNITEIEQEFDSKLLTRLEYAAHRFRFDTSGLIALDVATKQPVTRAVWKPAPPVSTNCVLRTTCQR